MSSRLSPRILRIGLVCLLCTDLACQSGHAGDNGNSPQEKDGIRVIRQGGYVEKVDPNVDFKDRLPRSLPQAPSDSLKTFHIVPGVRLEQVAAEPLATDVVDLTFDADGRLFVAELITYAEAQERGKVINSSRVSMLEDTDSDGHFDKSTIFADNLNWPSGLVCFDGGLFIATAPDIVYCKDTDGDGKSDIREIYFTGFDLSNPNACPNSLRWGLDHRIHGMASTAGGVVRAVKWESGGEGRTAVPVQTRGRDFSFDPYTGEFRLESGGGQYGMTYDDWGRKFESSNSAPIEMVMYDEHYLERNPYLAAPKPRIPIWTYGSAVYRTSPVEPWRIIRTELRIKGTFSGPVEGGGTPAGYFTGACGVHIYKGDVLPPAFHGNGFVGEGSGNLVHRMRLEPDGIEMKAYRTEQKKEFLTSDEIWFRPIQFTDGPDGALYIADMYREVYEHPDAVPPSARKYLDLLAGNNRGRVYRVVPENFKQPFVKKLSKASTAELVALLASENGWHRITASRLLYERQDPIAIPLLNEMVMESPSALARMHALYMLWACDALTPELVLARLSDQNARVREHAIRLAEEVQGDSPSVRAKLYAMADDPDARVRYQLAFTLGNIPGTQATDALGRIIRRDAERKWIRLAVLSSTFGRTGELLASLARDPQWCSHSAAREFLHSLAEQAGLQKRSDQVAEFFKWLEANSQNNATVARSIVAGLSKGLAKAKSPLLTRLQSGDSSSGALLASMITNAKKTASDERASIEERTQAIRSLATASFQDASHVLADLLDGRQPPPVQAAALQTLSRFDEPEVARMIVDNWIGFSPSVRMEAAEALFSRTKRIAVLLQAVDDAMIAPSQLAPARIQFLLAHPDETIRVESQRLLGGAKLARRENVVASYQKCLQMKGDPNRGRDVFRKECATCHRLEEYGYNLGLPLGSIKNRGPDTILLSVLDPNREVNPAYLNYNLITENGQMITGMITTETATSVTLTRAEGKFDTVLRTDIDELECTNLSVMPEGLEQQVSPEQMADLIAYLMHVQ